MDTDDLSGKVFVTSGLGGMSGAQAKVQEYLNRFKRYFMVKYEWDFPKISCI